MIDPDIYEIKMTILQIGVQHSLDDLSKQVYWSELSKVMDSEGFINAVDNLLTGDKPFFKTHSNPFPTISDIRKACPDIYTLKHKVKGAWSKFENYLCLMAQKEHKQRIKPSMRDLNGVVEKCFGSWNSIFLDMDQGNIYVSDIREKYEYEFKKAWPQVVREIFLNDINLKPRLSAEEIQKKIIGS